jgi:hypothetical protein
MNFTQPRAAAVEPAGPLKRYARKENEKENLGLVLISAILGSFIIGAVLQISNLETTNYGIFESIFLALAIVSASSGVLLWGIISEQCCW